MIDSPKGIFMAKGSSVGPFNVGDIPLHFTLTHSTRLCDAKFTCTRFRCRRVTKTIYVELEAFQLSRRFSRAAAGANAHLAQWARYA